MTYHDPETLAPLVDEQRRGYCTADDDSDMLDLSTGEAEPDWWPLRATKRYAATTADQVTTAFKIRMAYESKDASA